MYEFQSKVRYSEINEQGKLSLNGIINYFQDTTNLHSEFLGDGLQKAQETKHFWMLIFWQIVIDRNPVHAENIRVGTLPYDFSGNLGLRNFVIMNEKGEYLVRANSIWTMVDGTTGRPMRVPKETQELYGFAEPIAMDYAPRKIKVPEEMVQTEFIKVRQHMIDSNHHVNNGQYVQIAMDVLPSDIEIKELRVEYKRQAMLGDEIIPYVGHDEERYVVSLCGVDKKPYAIVAFYPQTKGAK